MRRLILVFIVFSTITGLVLALILIVGSQQQDAPAPQATREEAVLPLVLRTLPSTSSPVPSATRPNTPMPSTTPSITPTLSDCPPPDDWVAYTVQAGDTLFAFQLGTNNQFSVDDLIAANCLDSRFIFEGQSLWLPQGAAENAPSSDPIPTPFPTDSSAPPPGLSRSPQCPCTVTIRQGWRIEQVADHIDSIPVGFSGDELLSLTISLFGERPYFIGAVPNTSLEGYMMPGSYEVDNETDVVGFAEAVLANFSANTSDQLWADAGGLSPYQVITLASTVNRESRSYDQQVLIASVFRNRLATDRGLAATVTTMYALGMPGQWWPLPAQGQVSTFDSPYNTNLYKGLPPTPIASPTPDALRATVYPAETDYLYFTGNCRGTGNVYATTYEEHLANVRCE